MKLGTQHYLVYIIVLIRLELKITFICLKLRAKLRFYGFVCVFGTFSHQEVQTWFVWHEIWHTTLFGIYYCFEMVRIENHSYMVVFLRFFNRFLALARIK